MCVKTKTPLDMAQEKARRFSNRRKRDKFRYLSNVSILSTNSFCSDVNNSKSRIPSVKANQLPDHLLDVYEEAFDLLDQHDKGAIGTREVGTVMRALGKDPTDEEIVNIIKEVDRSGTGCLNFNDFLTFLAYIFQDEDSDEEWESVFNHFDKNGDGFIDEKDLHKTLVQLRVKFTDSDVQEMISEFSRKKSLNLDDFMSIVGRND